MRELDQALEVFHRYGFEYGDSVPNYGPMAVAAMHELGHAALIPGMVDIYLPRLSLSTRKEDRERLDDEPAPPPGEWGAVESWLARLLDRLGGEPWSDVLADTTSTLASGLGARAIHGLIRVGHAVSSLEDDETPQRRDELAFGLAYWAASYARPDAADDAARAFEEAALDRAAIARIVAASCRAGADRYLEHLDARRDHILGVMAPSALATLLPYLEIDAQHAALMGLRESGVLLDGRNLEPASADTRVDAEVARCAQSRDETCYRAACSIQEHAVTFAAACLRADALEADARLRNAAADGALHLSPPGYQEWR